MGWTKEEQVAYERLLKLCKQRPYNTTTDCLLVKRQVEFEAKTKDELIRLKASQTLGQKKLEAVMYVSQKINALQTAGILLQGALLQASMDYDLILAAQARKSIAYDILSTLVLTALPEIKLVGKVSSFFVRRFGSFGAKAAKAEMKAAVRSGETIEQLMERLDNLPQRVTGKTADRILTFSQSVDNQTKDIIEAIKDPLASRAEVDEQTQQLFAAHSGKNAIVTAALTELNRSLVLAMNLEKVCHAFVAWYQGDNVLDVVKGAFKASGLDEETTYSGNEFNLLREVLVYDMLRAYVEQHVTIYINRDDRRNFPTDDDDYPTFDGLDKAQRQLIYDRFGRNQFGAVRISDPRRPAINSIRSMLVFWKYNSYRLAPEKERLGQRR